MPYYMYVSLQDDDKIVFFTMDAGTGKLTPQGEVPVSGGPSPLTLSPDRTVLYVGHRTVPGISSFRIDPDTGALTQNGTVTPEAAPTFLSTDRTGRYVLSAYYQGAHAAVHPVGQDGAVGGPPIEWLETAIGAHAIQTDPSNTFAFVPHIDNRGGPNAIFQFTFDPTYRSPDAQRTAAGGPAAGDGTPPLLLPSQQGPALFLQRAGLERHRVPLRPRQRHPERLPDHLHPAHRLRGKQHLLPNSDGSLRDNSCTRPTAATTASRASP